MKNNSGYTLDLIAQALRKVDIFKSVTNAMLDELAGNIQIVSFSDGDVIITKGEEGDSMYVILQGTVRVHDDDYHVMSLGKYDFFGEIALLTHMNRISSVTAKGVCTVGVINRADFYAVLKQYPDVTRDIMNALCIRILRQNETLIAFLKNRESELVRLVEERTEELKDAQRQQFLQEKMASLGQLSSGIAHEIKNPLNFVNNFSQLSKDLLGEYAVISDEAERLDIISNVEKNLERIIEHGRRADSILNKLTQISERESTPRTLVDINTLCREAVVKTYTRFMNEFPWFTSGITMVLDKKLPLISVSRDDLFRSISNLVMNSFESMEEKIRIKSGTDYKPELIIETDSVDGQLIICVIDNGIGIKEENMGQIFLPFFTTKPSRRNIGIGLTLADNTIRGIRGRIEVTSAWDTGARLVVTLPE
ncbi:MAG TPA: cyclic nucleotide-binding domain-containing protein [Bacteroidia bacterium]|nr:cyclic nucleotide-binding domain-containing protein [Bacteroidia bacterium]